MIRTCWVGFVFILFFFSSCGWMDEGASWAEHRNVFLTRVFRPVLPSEGCVRVTVRSIILQFITESEALSRMKRVLLIIMRNWNSPRTNRPGHTYLTHSKRKDAGTATLVVARCRRWGEAVDTKGQEGVFRDDERSVPQLYWWLPNSVLLSGHAQLCTRK